MTRWRWVEGENGASIQLEAPRWRSYADAIRRPNCEFGRHCTPLGCVMYFTTAGFRGRPTWCFRVAVSLYSCMAASGISTQVARRRECQNRTCAFGRQNLMGMLRGTGGSAPSWNAWAGPSWSYGSAKHAIRPSSTPSRCVFLRAAKPFRRGREQKQ